MQLQYMCSVAPDQLVSLAALAGTQRASRWYASCRSPAICRRQQSQIVFCGQQGSWFDFYAGGSPGTKQTLGDLAVVRRLLELGSGDMLKRPQEVHFPGCINEAFLFRCQNGSFFAKINRDFQAYEMFAGEQQALTCLQLAAADVGGLQLPEPLAVGDLPGGGSYLILSGLTFRPFAMVLSPLAGTDKVELKVYQLLLHGGWCVRVYSCNPQRKHSWGGHWRACISINSQVTRLGTIALDNTLEDTWADFFIKRRLGDRFDKAVALLQGKGYDDAAAKLRRTGDKLMIRAADLLCGVDEPAVMLHGDLWLGNSAMGPDGMVTMYDPAGFYGHSEFDLCFQGWEAAEGFPGFSDSFYKAYHEVKPRAPGHDDRRLLYQTFHLLNHLLIYGAEYLSFVHQNCAQLL